VFRCIIDPDRRSPRRPNGLRTQDIFFERPILNSPYAYPGQHWELDEDGQPTNHIADFRRRSELLTPVPKPQKRHRRFIEIARQLECDEDKERFEERLGKIATANRDVRRAAKKKRPPR
jgi:hypothetical protein